MRKESAGRGYIYVIVKGHAMSDSRGRILEHRYVMSEHLGRPLNKDEIVHHIDEDPSNNNIENLELMSTEEHSSFHHKINEDLEFICPVCENVFYRTRHNANGDRTFCSRSCTATFYGTTEITHGTESGYRRKCRCGACREAHNEKMREYRRRKRAGKI